LTRKLNRPFIAGSLRFLAFWTFESEHLFENLGISDEKVFMESIEHVFDLSIDIDKSLIRGHEHTEKNIYPENSITVWEIKAIMPFLAGNPPLRRCRSGDTIPSSIGDGLFGIASAAEMAGLAC
jgi:hypothetical protein